MILVWVSNLLSSSGESAGSKAVLFRAGHRCYCCITCIQGWKVSYGLGWCARRKQTACITRACIAFPTLPQPLGRGRRRYCGAAARYGGEQLPGRPDNEGRSPRPAIRGSCWADLLAWPRSSPFGCRPHLPGAHAALCRQ